MRLRDNSLSLTKMISFMLPVIAISCQTVENPEESILPPPSPSSDYVFIPKNRIVFDYFDKGRWRIVTQEIDYKDESHIKSISSLWIFDFMPIEIVVLDNPAVGDPNTYAFKEDDGISIRKTNVYLPFVETAAMDENDDSQLPACKAGEFRAIARIVSSLKFIGLPNWDPKALENLNPPRAWFSLGGVVCLKIIRF